MTRLILHAAVFTVIAPGALTLAVPAIIIWTSGASATIGLRSLAAGALMVVGISVYVWCVRDFITSGKGTPAPYQPPTELVVFGLYRFVRNPIYLGVTAIIVCEAIMFGSLSLTVYAVLVLIGFHLRVVLYEEPTLARSFGAEWERYLQAVPRWLPRLRSRPLGD